MAWAVFPPVCGPTDTNTRGAEGGNLWVTPTRLCTATVLTQPILSHLRTAAHPLAALSGKNIDVVHRAMAPACHPVCVREVLDCVQTDTGEPLACSQQHSAGTLQTAAAAFKVVGPNTQANAAHIPPPCIRPRLKENNAQSCTINASLDKKRQEPSPKFSQR